MTESIFVKLRAELNQLRKDLRTANRLIASQTKSVLIKPRLDLKSLRKDVAEIKKAIGAIGQIKIAVDTSDIKAATKDIKAAAAAARRVPRTGARAAGTSAAAGPGPIEQARRKRIRQEEAGNLEKVDQKSLQRRRSQVREEVRQQNEANRKQIQEREASQQKLNAETRKAQQRAARARGRADFDPLVPVDKKDLRARRREAERQVESENRANAKRIQANLAAHKKQLREEDLASQKREASRLKLNAATGRAQRGGVRAQGREGFDPLVPVDKKALRARRRDAEKQVETENRAHTKRVQTELAAHKKKIREESAARDANLRKEREGGLQRVQSKAALRQRFAQPQQRKVASTGQDKLTRTLEKLKDTKARSGDDNAFASRFFGAGSFNARVRRRASEPRAADPPNRNQELAARRSIIGQARQLQGRNRGITVPLRLLGLRRANAGVTSLRRQAGRPIPLNFQPRGLRNARRQLASLTNQSGFAAGPQLPLGGRTFRGLGSLVPRLPGGRGASGIGALAGAAGFGGALAGAATAAAPGVAFAGTAKVGIERLANLERITTNLEVILKDRSAADKLIKELRNLEKETPVDIGTLAETGQKLAAAGFNPEEIPKLVDTIINAGSVGVDTLQNNIFRFTKAIAQIKANGRLLGEELLQLTDIGLGIEPIIQEKFGFNGQTLADKSQAGEIPIEEILDTILKGTAEKYGGALQRQKETLKGEIDTAQKDFKLFAEGFARPIFDAIKSGLKGINDAIEVGKLEGITEGLKNFSFVTVEGTKRLVENVAKLGPLFAFLNGGFSTFNSETITQAREAAEFASKQSKVEKDRIEEKKAFPALAKPVTDAEKTRNEVNRLERLRIDLAKDKDLEALNALPEAPTKGERQKLEQAKQRARRSGSGGLSEEELNLKNRVENFDRLSRNKDEVNAGLDKGLAKIEERLAALQLQLPKDGSSSAVNEFKRAVGLSNEAAIKNDGGLLGGGSAREDEATLRRQSQEAAERAGRLAAQQLSDLPAEQSKLLDDGNTAGAQQLFVDFVKTLKSIDLGSDEGKTFLGEFASQSGQTKEQIQDQFFLDDAVIESLENEIKELTKTLNNQKIESFKSSQFVGPPAPSDAQRERAIRATEERIQTEKNQKRFAADTAGFKKNFPKLLGRANKREAIAENDEARKKFFKANDRIGEIDKQLAEGRLGVGAGGSKQERQALAAERKDLVAQLPALGKEFDKTFRNLDPAKLKAKDKELFDQLGVSAVSRKGVDANGNEVEFTEFQLAQEAKAKSLQRTERSDFAGLNNLIQGKVDDAAQIAEIKRVADFNEKMLEELQTLNKKIAKNAGAVPAPNGAVIQPNNKKNP